MDLHDPQKREKKKDNSANILSHHHLTRGQERIFICIYHDRLSFLSVSYFWFLLSNDKDAVLKVNELSFSAYSSMDATR